MSTKEKLESDVPQSFKDYFKDLSVEAYDIMVSRQAGYGPRNIEALGPYGVFSRLAEDKCSRVSTAINGSIDSGKAIVDENWYSEGVRDALLDIANYAFILISLGEKEWSAVSRGTTYEERGENLAAPGREWEDLG
jgi:hypothetical protein